MFIKRNLIFLILGSLWITGCSPKLESIPISATTAPLPQSTAIPSTEKGIPVEFQGKLKLFILAGQSNMSGRGKVPEFLKKTNPRIFVFGNDYQWKIAEEPIDSPAGQIDHVSEDLDAGFSPAMSFAERLLESDANMVIGLIPCAKNSTSISAWQQDTKVSTLYGSCLNRIRQAAKMGVPAGLLFYQGETDSTDPLLNPTKGISDPKQWAQLFGKMVQDWRSDLSSPTLAVVFAQLAANSDPKYFINWEVIKEQQASVNLPYCRMIKTEDLTVVDGVHLSIEGYQETGKRFADDYLQIIR
jgi:hypothetical protein